MFNLCLELKRAGGGWDSDPLKTSEMLDASLFKFLNPYSSLNASSGM
jgi:hypothetical protein